MCGHQTFCPPLPSVTALPPPPPSPIRAIFSLSPTFPQSPSPPMSSLLKRGGGGHASPTHKTEGRLSSGHSGPQVQWNEGTKSEMFSTRIQRVTS